MLTIRIRRVRLGGLFLPFPFPELFLSPFLPNSLPLSFSTSIKISLSPSLTLFFEVSLPVPLFLSLWLHFLCQNSLTLHPFHSLLITSFTFTSPIAFTFTFFFTSPFTLTFLPESVSSPFVTRTDVRCQRSPYRADRNTQLSSYWYLLTEKRRGNK